MWDIPNAPLLDKSSLIGECVRLKIDVEAERLLQEVEALPASVWGSTGGRVGVHSAAEAVFLRGFAPAEGDKPIEDRPALNALPYLRQIIERQIEAPRLRCLLARLPAATSIPMHADRPPYFGKSIRLHVPVKTNPAVFMLSGKSAYRMLPGEIWALNNSAMHGVVNADPTRSRTHLICDFLPSAPLLAMLCAGERGLGIAATEIDKTLVSSELPHSSSPA